MTTNRIQRIDVDNISAATRRLYTRASLVSLLGNLLLVLGKGMGAWVSGSSAIYADAANSASDLAYSLLMGFGLWLSLQPPDSGHPHGHRRIEPMVSLVIGLAMTVAGIEAGRSGILAWQGARLPSVSVWPLIILVGSALTKGAMYLGVRRLATEAGSPALLASARDNLSDTVSSAAALVGLLSSRVLPQADPLAALVVAVWILRAAWQVLRQSVHQLSGGGASPELQEAVVDAALSAPGVLSTDRVIIEYTGPQVYVDIHVRMDGRATLEEVHRTSHAVRSAVQALEEVDHVFVHVEPARHVVEDQPAE